MRRPGIKLALFASFTVAITSALASVIGNLHPFRSQYPITAIFQDATGLLKSDIVTVAGVTVGKVGGIKVEKGLAKVELLIDKSVKLPKNTHIIVRYQNLLGQRAVLLQPMVDHGPYLSSGDTVDISQTEGPLNLDDVFNNLRPLLTTLKGEDVNTLSKALVESFAGHKGDLAQILSDTAKITSTLAPHEKQLSGLVEGVGTTASTLADQSEHLQTLIKNLGDITSTLGGKASALDRTLVNLNQASSDIGKLLSDNRPGLDQDISDLKTLLHLVVIHQSDVDQIASGLDDTLRATSRATGYGEWANLYVFSLCELGSTGCTAAEAASHGSSVTSFSTDRRSRGLDKLISTGTGAG